MTDNRFAVATTTGKIEMFQLKFNPVYDDTGNRTIQSSFEDVYSKQLPVNGDTIENIKYRLINDNEKLLAVLTKGGLIYLYHTKKSESLDEEESTVTDTIIRLDRFTDEKISSLDMSHDANKLLAGTISGKIYYISLEDPDNPFLVQSFDANPDQFPVTALCFLIGSQSIIIGDAKGKISSFMLVNDQDFKSGWKFIKSNDFNPLKAAITKISPSSRNKSFIVCSEAGEINVDHLTTDRTLLTLDSITSKIKDICFTPKADGAVALQTDGRLLQYDIKNTHPDVSMHTLFGKVWYEGYKQPQYIWQSSGAGDDFEPKFSLIPLIIGTFKGTIYALIFAIPIALLGAIYTSLFSHPKFKNIVKSVV
jgi:phosphate transport system permease protein